jgi:hypothetical protein
LEDGQPPQLRRLEAVHSELPLHRDDDPLVGCRSASALAIRLPSNGRRLETPEQPAGSTVRAPHRKSSPQGLCGRDLLRGRHGITPSPYHDDALSEALCVALLDVWGRP